MTWWTFLSGERLGVSGLALPTWLGTASADLQPSLHNTDHP